MTNVNPLMPPHHYISSHQRDPSASFCLKSFNVAALYIDLISLTVYLTASAEGI